MLEILIIGGGIHGTHLAHRLLQKTPLTHDDIRILDPNKTLLHEWRRCTQNCAMRYLRSPSVHHIDTDPFSLDKFAQRPENHQLAHFISSIERPSVALFDKHCRMVIDTHRIDGLTIEGSAHAILNHNSHIRVLTEKYPVDARMILFAIGMNNQPYWPNWAIRLREKGAPVHHVFDADFSLETFEKKGPVAVIGSGITGVQLALHLGKKGENYPMLFSKEAVRVSNFDFDPGWLGPKFLGQFQRDSPEKKRLKIKEARIKGSIPKEMKTLMDLGVAQKKIALVTDDIKDAACRCESLLLKGRHNHYECSQVLLATGFREAPPGNGLLAQTIKEFQLKTAPCGFPDAGPQLRWHKRIFVSGPLSELTIGPCARNIIGARHSGRRITAAINER